MHQETLFTLAWAKIKRLVMASQMGSLKILHSLKLTAKAPENRQSQKKIGKSNLSFSGRVILRLTENN